MIPDELKRMNRWVCAKNGSKMPFMATADSVALLNEPSTWTSYDVAKKSVEDGFYDYVGFVFANDGIVGIDIDDGFDGDGFMTPKAAEIIGLCQSYTERSRSGRGFHILLKGQLPFKGRNNRDGVEIYQTGRYFIITENETCFHDVIGNQTAINTVIEKYFPVTEREQNTGKTPRIYNPTWEKPQDGKIPVRPTYPPITEGNRNISLASLAGSMHTDGYTDKQIYLELVRVNQTVVQPPVSDRELENIVISITRYRR